MRAALGLGCLATLIMAAPIDGTALDSKAEHDHIDVVASTRTASAPSTSSDGAPVVLHQTMSAATCRRNLDGSAQLFPCPGDQVQPVQQCVDAGLPTVAPLWERTRVDATSGWGDWQLVTPAGCGAAAAVPPDLVLAELRRMTLAPSPLVVQPDRGWVLVNKPTVAFVTTANQTLTTTILGTAVTITATPVSFTWDFADGPPVTTASPGHPWPHADVTHTYRRTGTFRIGVTTTWGATYTTAGDPTVREVPGTATTTSSSDPFTANELRSHLVAGTCLTDPHGPGC